MVFLKKRIPKLNASYLRNRLGQSVMAFRSLDSTNSLMKEYAKQNAPAGTVVIAESQTAGRGRGEHAFFSPIGTGIYLSLLLRYEKNVFRPADITAAAGVAACRAIEAMADVDCSVKWMNDIYINGKKTAGILAEAGSMPEGSYHKGSYVIVGVGFNLKEPEGGFPEEIKERAGAIFAEKMPRYAREKVACLFVKHLEKLLGKESHTLYGSYRDRLFLFGKTVIYEGREAVVEDLLPDFRLKLTFHDGSSCLLDSGEVSLPPFSETVL